MHYIYKNLHHEKIKICVFSLPTIVINIFVYINICTYCINLFFFFFQIDAPLENEADVESDVHNFESTSPEKGFKGK